MKLWPEETCQVIKPITQSTQVIQKGHKFTCNSRAKFPPKKKKKKRCKVVSEN